MMVGAICWNIIYLLISQVFLISSHAHTHAYVCLCFWIIYNSLEKLQYIRFVSKSKTEQINKLWCECIRRKDTKNIVWIWKIYYDFSSRNLCIKLKYQSSKFYSFITAPLLFRILFILFSYRMHFYTSFRTRIIWKGGLFTRNEKLFWHTHVKSFMEDIRLRKRW